MAADNSFDVISKVDVQEVKNAMEQAIKEVRTRFDLKDSHSEIKLLEGDEAIELASSDQYKLKASYRDFAAKVCKTRGFVEGPGVWQGGAGSGSSVRQKITLQQGIPGDKAKEIVKLIKESKKKIQASIQGDTVRITGKDRDTLQEAIALIKGHDFGIDMQFTNYRTN